MGENGEQNHQQKQQYGYSINNQGVRPYPHRDYSIHYHPNGATSNGQLSDNSNGLLSSISSGFNSLVTNLFGWSSAYQPATYCIYYFSFFIITFYWYLLFLQQRDTGQQKKVYTFE